MLFGSTDWAVVEDFDTEDEALEEEAWWIEFLGSHTREGGFNLRYGVRGGMKHSAETCKKISEGQKTRTCSEAHRQRLREVNLGKKASEETKAKQSAVRTGRKLGPMRAETKAKLSAKALERHAAGFVPGMKGRKHTEETKAKLRGPRATTEERREKYRMGARAREAAKKMKRAQQLEE